MRGKLTPERAKPADKDDLSIASYNVENLDAVDDAERMPAIARQIIDNLRSPDILALNEMQDIDGEGPLRPGRRPDVAGAGRRDRRGGRARATSTARSTRSTTRTAARRTRTSASVSCSTRRGCSSSTGPGGTAVTATEDDPAQPGAQLTFSPGRVDPTQQGLEHSRKPLAGEFRYRGKKLFVVANHFASKGGDAALFGRFQEPYRPSEIQRRGGVETRSAARPASSTRWVERLQDADRWRRVVVLGDLNDFDFSETIRDPRVGRGRRWPELVDLWHFVPRDERYSYIFQGNGQVLDHIRDLADPAARRGREFDAVHINAEFDTEQLSDHDPPLLRLDDRPRHGHPGSSQSAGRRRARPGAAAGGGSAGARRRSAAAAG